jgi:glycosyltransferase involved in cell wall biosynthesis
LKILFDGVFNCKPKSGIHRYFFNLVANLPEDFIKYSTMAVTQTNIRNHYSPPFNHFRPHRMSYFLEYVWFRKHCYSRKFDLVHSSYYNLSTACLYLIKKDVPHVITVHDLIHELFDKKDSHDLESRGKILRNAQAIITVSQNTKMDLLKVYNSIDERKIHVIHHALHEQIIDTSSITNQYLNSLFILYVGHREGYKNFNVLLPALKELNKTNQIQLVVVGPDLTTQEKQTITKYGVESNIRTLGQVSDEHLALLYSKCLAFTYTSLYEGFGYPLIEAMAQGAIPIASNVSCIPEVLGSAGLLVEPNCFQSIVREIVNLIQDNEYRLNLKNDSIKRTQAFSIQKNIDRTKNIYKKVVSRLK